jgi:heme-degrading monooxygenase HmoA
MSVYMSLRLKADPAKMEEVAAQNQEMLQAIAERARAAGCVHHTFAAGDGEVIVMDEWESPEAFQRFFEAEQDVPKLMEQVGVEGQPEPTFYRPLGLGDEF